MEYDQLVDIKGLCCSAPVLRLTKEFKAYASGSIVLVISDKCSMVNDIPAYCKLTRNELLQQAERDGVFHFWIRKT